MFKKQHSLFKIISISIIIFFSISIPYQVLLKISVLSLLFLIPTPKIFINFLILFSRISIFFISILIGGFIFDIDFLQQLILIGKITFFLLLLTYLRTTVLLKHFISDTNFLFKSNSKFLLFITSLSIFIDKFLEVFSSFKFSNGTFKHLQIEIDNIYRQSDLVHVKAHKLINNIEKRKLEFLPNLYLFIFLALFFVIRFG